MPSEIHGDVHGEPRPETSGGAWDWIDDDSTWTPPPVDLTRPSIARIYDYGLGGKDNYPVDRAVAEKFMAFAPDVPLAARANREFLTAAVRAMLQAGIRQFI